MALGDERIWKIDQPIGVRSQADQRSINIERQRAQFLGKVMREARRNKDLQGYLNAEAAGYKDRGIENVDDKNRRYLDKVHQDRFYGDAAVGPGQRPTGGAQPPTGGAQPASRLGTNPTPKMDAQQSTGGQQQVPSARTGGITPVMINGREALFAGNNDNVMRAAIADRDNRYGDNASPTGAQPAAPVMSAAEQSKQATLEKTLAGNFGKVAQARAQAQQSGGTYDATPGFDTRTEGRSKFVDTIKGLTSPSDENLLGMMTEEQEKQAREQGAKLGLSEDQINDTINGEGDLSPKAVAERAKGRKDAAYQKEFGDSDKKIEEAIAGLDKTKFTPEQIAQIKENMKGLSSQDRKDSTEKAATSRAEREQKRFEKETVANQELDTYNPLGDAIDRAQGISDQSKQDQEKRDIARGVRNEIDNAKRAGAEERILGMKDDLRRDQRDNMISGVLSDERKGDIDRTATQNLGEYNPSAFNDGDGKNLLPPSDKIGEMDEKQIRDYVSKKRKVEEGKSRAFNEALGGESAESKTNLIPLERKELSNELYTRKTHKGKEYTRDDVSAFKKDALGKGRGAGLRQFDSDAIAKEAQRKILDAAAKSGYPIWNDKELMGDPNFSRMIGEDPRFKGKVPSGNGAPQVSIDTNNASKEFRSSYDSLKALELFTI